MMLTNNEGAQQLVYHPDQKYYSAPSKGVYAMKTFAVSSTVALLLLFAFSGCHIGVQGSGVRKTEKRDLEPFTAIETSGAFEVEVTCQKPTSFEIEGDDNLLPLIQTEVRHGVLHVSSSKPYSSRTGISLRIATPDLERIRISGAGKIRLTEVKSDKFEIHSSGAAMITASGQTKSLDINSSGAGTIDTHNLRAETAEVSVSGAAAVDVYASDQLDASVSGAGRVTYSGNPKVSKHVSGAGQVTKKEESGA